NDRRIRHASLGCHERSRQAARLSSRRIGKASGRCGHSLCTVSWRFAVPGRPLKVDFPCCGGDSLARRTLHAALHYGKRVVPFLISFGLVAWLIWKVTPEKLRAALAAERSVWLLVATLVQLLV